MVQLMSTHATNAAGSEQVTSPLPIPLAGALSPVGQRQSVEHLMVQLGHDPRINPRYKVRHALNKMGFHP
jgi:hypothetical protein